jgi:hypothetical protein
MTITQIKEKAESLGIEPGRRTKADLIAAIQKAEGNLPCFSTMLDGCPYIECSWTKDCARIAIGAAGA